MAQDKQVVSITSKAEEQAAAALSKETDLQSPALYINRELAWLEFNRRVLEEAEDTLTPALEKLKFSSIFSSNLDEFFMVRVGGLMRVVNAGLKNLDPSGRTPEQEIEEIAEKVRLLVKEQYESLKKPVLSELRGANIYLDRIDDLGASERERLNEYFEELVFPVLTPLAVDAGHPFPFLGNLKLNIMVVFKEPNVEKGARAYAFVEVPSVLPRLIPVKGEGKKDRRFVLLEDLVKKNIKRLFPGMEITDTLAFRLTRNQDYDLHEEEVMDLAASVHSELHDRTQQIAVRVEIEAGAPKKAVKLLCQNLALHERFVYYIDGPINVCDLMALYDLPVEASFKDEPFNPRIPQRFASGKDIFTTIKEGDALLHHPYDSFAVVMDFINAAADDPDVLAIKQTLYRVGKDSPVISALRRAAENGKHVTAVVELKARFDEEHNIDRAVQMQESGVNAVFGFVKWKTHCKATLVVRREGKHLKRYVHVSTGNYNAVTAKLYTDIGLFTCDKDFGNDVSALFNVLTGFNSWTGGEMFTKEKVTAMFSKFSISPVTTRDTMHRLIEREIETAKAKKQGRIIAKMNALVDPETITKLYEASKAGVRIDLLVRGICCLRPGIPGISENIRVTSILDRFLEHSRLYYFHNGGNPEIYSGSADWMPRNFSKRVEILYPILNNDLKSRIMDEILLTYLKDNVKARIMQSDGSYTRKKPKDDDKTVRSQAELIAIARKGGVKSAPYEEIVKKIGKKAKRKL
ncbi:MAG: polyphosphate kinase 1 [Deltaproteobacteria bacterium]|nr:polyphosphate kinase 1 [Deltaproteobacteria bacterium]